MNADISAMESSSPKQAPRLYSDQEVNDLLTAKIAAKEEKLRREYAMQQSQPASPSVNKDELYGEFRAKMLEEMEQKNREQNELLQRQAYEQTTQSLLSKMEKAAQEDKDFVKLQEDFDFDVYRDVVLAADKMPNTTDVLKEVWSDRKKAVELQSYANIRDWRTFNKKLKELSDSLATNKNTEYTGDVVAPYTKVKSGVASVNNGPLSVEDFAKVFRH